jgi:agmatine deiminase
MTGDSQTNFLYLADSLPVKYPAFYNALKLLIEEQGIRHGLLPGTRDVWAVDYMPIQLSNGEFIQFTYSPDYLRNSKTWRKTISDVDAICRSINIKTKKSEIILDGGNLIRAGKKAILCDKIFSENPGIPQSELIGKLMDLLQVEELTLIPTDPEDFTGHADGLVRFYDEDTVLVNDYGEEESSFKHALESALTKAGFRLIRVPYNPYENASKDDAIGTYLNFLQMTGFLLIPVFDKQEDEQALRLFEQLYPKLDIRTVNSSAIARDGGLLNCISWNIKLEE